MKQKRLFNILSLRGLLPLMAVFLCLIGGTGQAWATTTYKAKLTANGEAGKGYVYASKTSGDAAATYGAALTTKTSAEATRDNSSSVNLYAWAYPARAYKFNGWTYSTSPKAAIASKTTATGTNDNIQVTGKSDSTPVGTATASWTALTPYTITYLAPENGSYKVQYSYIDNKSGNTGLQLYNGPGQAYTMTEEMENQAVTSYERDEVTLSVVGGTFLGWKTSTDGISWTSAGTDEDTEYALFNNDTRKVSGNLYVKAEFKEKSENQASVTISGVTTNYKTWAEALAAANASSANPTITLLDNVLDLTASQSITKSMTLDLNDYSITGNVTKLININGEGITVTIRDNGEKGKGTISMIGSGNAHLYGVFITKGTLNFESGTIHAENTTTYASGSSERASAVYVTNPYTFNMTGGKIEAVSDYYAYGVNIAAGSATSHGKANISGGVIESTSATNVRGILNYGDLTITGGEIIANTTTTTGAAGIYVDGANKAVTNIEGGTITATAFTTTSYGVYVNNASNIVNVTGGTILAKTVGTTTAYGIFHNAAATTNVSGGTISGNPKTDTGYGIYSKGGTINVSDGTIFGNATGKTGVGIYANAGTVNVEGGVVKSAAPTSTSYALQQASSAVFNITGGKFYTTSAATLACATAATAANMKIYGGYYNLRTNLLSYIPANYEIFSLTNGAAYDEGYRFQPAAERPKGVEPCKVTNSSGTTLATFYSLENALTYVNQNAGSEMNIIMLGDYTLPAGYYTIPAKVTLVIPRKDGVTKPQGTTIERANDNDTKPVLYRKLTFESGVHMEVSGNIEIGGKQNNYGSGKGGSGRPIDTYAQLVMNEGSDITIMNGAQLRAYGFITGAGEIDARRGSTVYEQFQIYDFRGGSCTLSMNNNSKGFFPVNQYYIHNIEVSIKFHPGSKEYTQTAVVSTGANVQIIGTEGETSLFTMNEEADENDTWVRKEYDPVHDRQIYAINSSAKINAVSLKLGSYGFNSSSYVLPITNNMDIHLLTGEMEITQNVKFLAGATLEIDKEATGKIKSGKSVYFYSASDWGTSAYSDCAFAPVGFSPSWSTNPRKDKALTNAELNVHGTLEVNGAIYTSSEGANIISQNENAGTIVFKVTAPTTNATVNECNNAKAEYTAHTFVPALLNNGDASTISINPTAAGQSYCYIENEWKKFTTSGCFVYDQNNVYYAKPHDYVALSSNTEDANHLYHSQDGTRHFILMEGCQWWDVNQTEEDDDVYYCADNDTYYVYEGGEWTEKTIKVTWVNFDGSKYAEYTVNFGGTPKYLGTNPRRANDTYYTYSFVGWLPEITDDTKLFENTTYVAQYERKDLLYAITFKDGTKTIETDYYSWGSMPECEKLPTKAGYILSWSPALGAVSGNQTYTAVWTEETVDPTTLSYTVTWKNYEGTTLETDTEVPYGATPSYDGETPAKAAIKDIAFVHDGWTPDVVPVTGNVTYTAKFRETPALYTVTFLAQDGITVLDEQQVAYGEVPVCQNMPTQTSTAEYYYVAKWDKQITAVTGDVTYTHDGFTAYKNTCRLTVAAGANGAVKLDGASDPLSAIYDYGTNVTISATAAEHYHFAQWSDGNTSNPRTVTVTETKTLTAQFAIDQVTITWLNYDGATIATSEFDYGTTPAYSGATPSRPAGCGVFYTFNGWTPVFAPATEATSYTAQYNEVSNPSLKSYQVAFEANGGTGSMSNQSFTYGVAQSLKANTFTHAPYTITYVYENGEANTSAEAAITFNDWSDGVNSYTDQQSVNNLTDECDGVVTLTAQWAVGSVTLPTPERAGYTFNGWFDGAEKVGDAGASYAPTSTKTLTAQWTELPLSEDINATGDVTITESKKVNNLTISENGSVTIDDDAAVTVVNNLFLEATPDNNLGAVLSGNIQVQGDAYIDINMNGSGKMNKGYYYSFAVPFSVNVNDGVFRMENGNAVEMVPNKGFMAYKYNEVTRANSGVQGEKSDNCWDLVSDGTFEPGVFYLILFSSNKSNTYRFKWNGTGSVNNHADISVTTTGSDATNSGWHGVANNGLGYTKMTGDFTIMQTLKSEDNVFEPFTITDPVAMANPVFIQMATGTIDLSTPTTTSAPRRAAAVEKTDLKNVRLTREGADKHDDQIFFSASEEAENQYTIGHDVAKMFMGTAKKAQLWINAYGQRLVANEAVLNGDEARYPLSLYAPAAGDYVINVNDNDNANDNLYLLYEGAPVWNLSLSGYSIHLEAGTTEGYEIVLKRAPRVSTGMENVINGENAKAQKILFENKLFIICGEHVFDGQGKLVK